LPVVIAVVVALLMVVGSIVWVLSSDDDTTAGPDTTDVAATSGGSGVTTATPANGSDGTAVVAPSVVNDLPTTGQPVEIAVAGGSLGAPDDGGVERFTPPGPDAQLAGRVDLGSAGYGNDMIVGDETMFVTRYQGQALATVDLATGEVGGTPVSMPGQALTGATSGDTIFVTVHGSSSGAPGAVVAVRDGAVVDEIALEQRPYQIEAVADRLWVTFFEAGSIGLIDPATHDVTVMPIGQRPVDVRLIAGQLWVTISAEDRIMLIDPASGAATTSIQVGDNPWKVDEGFGAVWMTNQGDGQSAGSVMRIDPTTYEVSEPIPVGVKPDEITVGTDHLFVGNVGSRSISVIDPG
jgi:streptogramin lyase